MGFVDDQYVVVGEGQGSVSDKIPSTDYAYSIGINLDDPFIDQDLQVIVKTFEVEASEWSEDDYAMAYHYKDVYTLRRFSYRVQQQLNYYPGMHQSMAPPKEDPFKTNAERMANQRLQYWNRAMDSPDAFMSGLKSREQDFDYRDIFGADTDSKDRAEQIGKLITQCIPCFDRLIDPNDLLPDGDLLELHLLNIKIRSDILDKLKSLLSDPGYYLDICELLNALSKMCPQDLLAILALLSQYLAKLNLDVKFNLDLIVSLVGPILSPFLDSLSAWLDKWIQMILAPLICVVDHINEVIMLTQQIKIPLSEANLDVDTDVGVALPFHQDSFSSAGVQANPDGAWAGAEQSFFQTPDKEKYNPTVPRWPTEENEMALQEVGEEWNPSMTEEDRAEQNQRWRELKEEEKKRRMVVPPPLRRENPDGRRWYKEEADDIESYKFQTGMRPPEEQTHPKTNEPYYLDASPIVNSVLQLRNIMQAGIAYVQDWFEYVTQMIHDLIGTDFGWMNKKTDSTMMKSRLIQLIYLIKALITAISKNGLKCGVDSNFDQGQLRYVLEVAMNQTSQTYQFSVQPDGTVIVRPPDGPLQIETIDNAQGHLSPQDSKIIPEAAKEPGVTGEENEQKSSVSGIIIKDCLKSVAAEDVQKVRQWIADFEKKGS